MFLDEVGDMPLPMQAKLLRVLENGEIVRVGSNDPRQVDVRVISATNSDLSARVKDKEFREDLYFRIKGATIDMPPLRGRRDDIPLLIDHFIALANDTHETNVKDVTAEARRLLVSYPWPGNVRQLKNVIENMVVLAGGNRLTVDDLPEEIHNPPESLRGEGFDALAGLSVEEVEKEHIRATLKMVDGKREQAAKLLGMGERTLYRKIKEYGLKD
jgi:two-component system response regulator HydG